MKIKLKAIIVLTLPREKKATNIKFDAIYLKFEKMHMNTVFIQHILIEV